MSNETFEIERLGPGELNLVLWNSESPGGPEILGRFNNPIRAWMAAKAIAADRGLDPGQAPWMRTVKLSTPKNHRF